MNSPAQALDRRIEGDRSLTGKLMGGQVNRSANRRVALKRDLAETLKFCEDVPPFEAAPKGGGPSIASPNPSPSGPSIRSTSGSPGETRQALPSRRKPLSVAYLRRNRHPALSRPVRKVVPQPVPTGPLAEAKLVLAFIMRSFALPELADLIVKSALVVVITVDALRSSLGSIEWRPAASPFGPRSRTETKILSGR